VGIRRITTVLGTLDLRGRLAAGETLDYRRLVPRAPFDVDAAMAVVRPICDDVAERGLAALTELSERFDHVVPEHFRVPPEALAEAEDALDPKVRAAFQVAIDRRRAVARAERGDDAVAVDVAAGARVIHKIIPVNRVGLYVPGGLAPLASSVIMNVVPAQVAGVRSIAVASPPQQEFGGLPHPNILALCRILGVDEVYAVGGAQAVAMFAYGVPDLCAKVDLVTGPGNIYVVAAKRLLKGRIGIDSEAGPTEIAILADDTAVPDHVAADLISQAEHDPLAGSVLVTDSPELAAAVDAALEPQIAKTLHVERIRTALSGPQSGIVLVDDLAQGLEVVDAYGAEHLEIHTRNAFDLAQRVTNAGAIFVGTYSPVSLGDYCAGSTHVLPTAGAAAHSSGLTVASFLKQIHLISYDAEALADVRGTVETFAAAENLPAHGAAVTVRFAGDPSY
jgi:histidinol dehydrogenase